MGASNLSAVVASILQQEGGYSDDLLDPGGETNFGITQATADELGLGPVKNLTKATAASAYAKLFAHWNITAIVDEALFWLVADACVNHGPGWGIRWLQEALPGVTVDGDIGPHTEQALDIAKWPHVYAHIIAARCRFYGQIISHHPSQSKFAGGWAIRLASFIEPWPYGN